jgi:pimeloyl-ACP methyl ester carboxylesterase
MQINSILVDGVNILYLEINPHATKTLFFIHGNSCTHKLWRYQYKSILFAEYRLIVFDLPGHGGSDLPPKEKCTIPGIAELVSKAVLELSNGKPYFIVSLSLGTNIAVEMLAFGISPAGIVLAGPCIVGRDYPIACFIKPDTHVAIVFSDEANEEDVAKYSREVLYNGREEDLECFLKDYYSTKVPLRTYLNESIINGVFNDEIALLQGKDIPLLVVFGADEMIVDPHYLDHSGLNLWKESVFKIPGAGHLVNVDQPEEFNRLVWEFVEVCD